MLLNKTNDEWSFIAVNELRPCMVYGSKAIFHKWIEENDPIFQSNILIHRSKLNEEVAYIRKAGACDGSWTVHENKHMFALVEFENGTVSEVLPQAVTFLDSGKRFQEYYEFFKEDNDDE